MCSLRALRPHLDPHDYCIQRQQKIKEEQDQRQNPKVTISGASPEKQETKRSAPRAKSIARYRDARQLGQNETGSNRRSGEDGVAETRGRPRNRS